MAVLDNVKLGYEDLPAKKLNTRKGGKKNNNMSKANKVTEPTPKKVYAPTRLEVAKTVLIFVMFTAIVAFVGGMSFQKNHDIEIRNAVSAAQAEVAPVAEAKK